MQRQCEGWASMSNERKPVFMISTESKTEDELADEIFEAAQAHYRATGQLPPKEDDDGTSA